MEEPWRLKGTYLPCVLVVDKPAEGIRLSHCDNAERYPTRVIPTQTKPGLVSGQAMIHRTTGRRLQATAEFSNSGFVAERSTERG